MKQNYSKKWQSRGYSGLAKVLTIVAMLLCVGTGAWAQSTTHVVSQSTVNTIFSGDGYTLGNAVKDGDVLDFQGTIDLETASHSLVINKQVTVKSSTKDAVLKLHTPAGDRTGNNPGSTFVINKAGSGTAVQDIRLENTGMWIFNTSNVTFTGVTFHVEGASVCSGVGHVAIRYSDHVTFDGCTVYTKDNGGSGCCVLTGSHDCTFKDTRFENAGNAGNVLYIGNPYNFDDKPADYTMNNDNISVINCTFTAESSGGLSNFQIVGGLRHRIENCMVNFATGISCSATASEDGHVIRNNTFTKGLTVPKASTFTGNSVTGNVTINANNATVNSTTVYLGSTITGNSILGKVTFNSNSKNNTFTGNTVISSEAYAVVMASTKDANNTVTDNVLLAASNAGDAAVNLNNGTGNTISNNLSEAATGDVTWNFDAATGTLTIGGTGAMADYDQTTAPWAFLSDKITRVIIGEGVTKVGNNAFQGCTALNDVFVKGAGTLTIGTAAFDATKTPAIYVPVGTEATYQTAWSAYAGSIGEYMNCGADAMAVYDAASHTLTICGKGAMTDFASAADQPWKSLQGQLQTVSFEPFITAIGTNAFSGCTALTTANIEGTGVTIADGAFDGNATGRRIFVPAQAIAGYGESAYLADIYSAGQCGAEGSDVSWELGAQTMALAISGTGAMADYANANSVPWTSVHGKITSVTIAEGVTSIGNYAFYMCSSLTTVSLPEGLTSIGSYAFSSCTALTAITIPDGLTSIGSNAFSGCSNLASVNIPATVTSIGSSAFRSCTKLESITLPAGLTSIGSYVFSSCTALTAITIPDGVTSIGSNAFSGCSNLASVNIPDGLTSIDSYLFDGCSNLANVNIPATVTSIGASAFRNCTMLESITLPVSVTSVGSQAFRYCSKLAEINIFAPSLTTYGNNAFMNTPDGLKIYVPAISLDTYKTGWSAYADKFAALPYYDVTLNAEGLSADEAATWQVAKGTDQPAAFPLTGVAKGETVTATYTGTKKIMGVDAKIYDPIATPLTLEVTATGGETSTIRIDISGTLTTGMKYSVNGGEKKIVTASTNIEGLNVGDKVQFYGNGTETQMYGYKDQTGALVKLAGGSAKVKVYGNIMSLIDETGFATTTLPLQARAFYSLFKGNTNLVDASDLLLPATKLGDNCYEGMFYGCSNLTAGPKELPATTLGALRCYAEMFRGCGKLTAAPKMFFAAPTNYICLRMFYQCSSLKDVYIKAAYSSSNSMYKDMFSGATATGAVLHTISANAASWNGNCGSWTVQGDWPSTVDPTTWTVIEPSVLSVDWNAATKTGTFTMPGNDVELIPNVAPTAQFAIVNNMAQLPAAAEGIYAATSAPLITAGTAATGQGKVMYLATTDDLTADQAKAANGWSETVPTAEGFADNTMIAYVWYYIQATDAYNDSEPVCIPITFPDNKFNLTLNAANAYTIDATQASKGTVTVAGTNKTSAIAEGKLNAVTVGSKVKLTAATGYKFRKVEVTNDSKDPLATPMTIKALTDGTIVVYKAIRYTYGIKYSVNGGDKAVMDQDTYTINVNAGDEVQFYGNGTNITDYGYINEDQNIDKTVIGGTAKMKVFGNIMSLLDEEHFATNTELPNPNQSSYFWKLFNENTNLTDASGLLLPSKTLATYCYGGLFYGCTSLTAGPKLPATQMAKDCYSDMFNGCTSLTKAPELPATELAEKCYFRMFRSCTSLTSVYVKAGYAAAQRECSSMFDGTSTAAVLHTTSGSQSSWETMMGTGKTWDSWTVSADWTE